MVWFVPKALLSEAIDKWVFPGDPFVKHKIGRWPHPNTNRTKSGFIMETDRDLAHTAFKRLFCWNLGSSFDEVNFPNWQNLGWLDLDVVGNSDVHGDSDTNIDGWVCHEEIKFLDDLPVLAAPGVEVKMELTHAASGHFAIQTFEFPETGPQWHWDRDANPSGGGPTSQLLSPSFPYLNIQSFEWAMSDCFLFPRQTAGPLDFANFNGVDASILFDAFTNATNQRIQLEFDVLLRDTSQCVILGRGVNTTRHVDLTPASFVWRTSVVLLSPDLPLDEFGTVRAEFNWNDPGTNWKVYWNGSLRGSNAGAGASGLFFNTMGRHGSFYKGDFGMKNLTLQDTDPGAARLLLSTELQVNACDIGEKELKGTTENMTLSSCP